MNNKNNVIFGIIGIIVILAICIVSPMLTSKSAKSISANSDEAILARATKEANSINEDEMKDFNKIDVDTYIELYEGENPSLVLVGRSGCKYCTIAEPIIKNLMHLYDFDISYVSTDDFTQESYEKFSNSNALLSSFSTPLLMNVSNGEVTDYIQGLVDTAGYFQFFVKNGIIEDMEG